MIMTRIFTVTVEVDFICWCYTISFRQRIESSAVENIVRTYIHTFCSTMRRLCIVVWSRLWNRYLYIFFIYIRIHYIYIGDYSASIIYPIISSTSHSHPIFIIRLFEYATIYHYNLVYTIESLFVYNLWIRIHFVYEIEVHIYFLYTRIYFIYMNWCFKLVWNNNYPSLSKSIYNLFIVSDSNPHIDHSSEY